MNSTERSTPAEMLDAPSQEKGASLAGSGDEQASETCPGKRIINFIFGRLGWLIVAILLLTIGYLVCWQRGFYQDDYANRAEVVNVITGEKNPIWSTKTIPGFPVRAMAWALNRQLAVWLPEHEFPIRVVLAVFAGLNALLLGLFVKRLLRAKLPGVIAGWLFLTPLFAHDAVLWAGAASYLVTFTLMMLSIHALMNAVTARSHRTYWIWALCGAVPFFFSLLFFEQPALLVGILPFAAAALAKHDAAISTKQAVLRSVRILLRLGEVSVVYGALTYVNSNMVSSRGGLDLHPAHIYSHAMGFLHDRLMFMVCSRWSQTLFEDALQLGVHTLASGAMYILLGVAAAGAVLLTSFSWKEAPASQTLSRGGVLRVLGITISGGVFLFLVILLFPGCLVQGQILEYRMLYFPHAAVCIVVAAALWGGVALSRSLISARVALLACGLLSCAYAVHMLGFCEALAKRHTLDQAHVQQITEALPADCIPQNAVFVPMMLDHRLPGTGENISMLLFGSFESDFSTHAELRKAYARPDLAAIVMNRWHGITFAAPPEDPSLSSRISIQGQVIPIDVAIPFTQYDGRLAFVEKLSLQDAEGHMKTVQFPAVTAIAPTSAAKLHLSVPAGKQCWNTKDDGVSVSVTRPVQPSSEGAS